MLWQASDYLDVKGLKLLSVGKKLITLRCGVNHDSFVVEGHIALKLRLLRSMLLAQPKCANNPIILPNVTSAVLAPVLEFYRKQTFAEAASLNETKINEMNQEYVKIYTRSCFDLIRAASYLEARSLLELLVNSVKAVPRLAELTPEEIVTEVVEGQYTKEEENAMVVQLMNAVA